jgi:hypothetical protein
LFTKSSLKIGECQRKRGVIFLAQDPMPSDGRNEIGAWAE